MNKFYVDIWKKSQYMIVLKTVLFTLKKMFQALNQLKTKIWLHLNEFKLASADRKTS